jgi:hypothetical protein
MTYLQVIARISEEKIYPPIAGVTHRLVDSGGLRLHVAELDQGEPVLRGQRGAARLLAVWLTHRKIRSSIPVRP